MLRTAPLHCAEHNLVSTVPLLYVVIAQCALNTLNMYYVFSSQDHRLWCEHTTSAALVLAQCADHHQINVRNFMNNLIIIKWCYCAGFITFTR